MHGRHASPCRSYVTLLSAVLIVACLALGAPAAPGLAQSSGCGGALTGSASACSTSGASACASSQTATAAACLGHRIQVCSTGGQILVVPAGQSCSTANPAQPCSGAASCAGSAQPVPCSGSLAAGLPPGSSASGLSGQPPLGANGQSPAFSGGQPPSFGGQGFGGPMGQFPGSAGGQPPAAGGGQAAGTSGAPSASTQLCAPLLNPVASPATLSASAPPAQPAPSTPPPPAAAPPPSPSPSGLTGTGAAWTTTSGVTQPPASPLAGSPSFSASTVDSFDAAQRAIVTANLQLTDANGNTSTVQGAGLDIPAGAACGGSGPGSITLKLGDQGQPFGAQLSGSCGSGGSLVFQQAATLCLTLPQYLIDQAHADGGNGLALATADGSQIPSVPPASSAQVCGQVSAAGTYNVTVSVPAPASGPLVPPPAPGAASG